MVSYIQTRRIKRDARRRQQEPEGRICRDHGGEDILGRAEAGGQTAAGARACFAARDKPRLGQSRFLYSSIFLSISSSLNLSILLRIKNTGFFTPDSLSIIN